MESHWAWRYEGYDPSQERLREALCTLGNGRFATRGAACELPAGPVHYPGTYAAGCYNRLTSHVAGRDVDNEDMVNLPNWLPLRVRAAGGGWFTPDDTSVLDCAQVLDMRQGTLTRRMRLRDADGRELELAETRLVHMADPYTAGQRLSLTAHGWDGDVEIEGGLDGNVSNAGVERYRDLDGRHLADVCAGTAGTDTVFLTCRTSASDIKVAMAARIRPAGGPPGSVHLAAGDGTAVCRMTVPVTRGETVAVEKTVALHTSRDPAIADPLHAALARVARAPDFGALLASHATAWHRLWSRAELTVPGKAGTVLRLHLFHVLQTLSPHTADLDAGVPARGLHGEAYRGHVFWDELFVLPFLNLHLPEISRALLAYRYRRLDAACRAAAAEGRAGAMYPWQSGSDGREETQRLHLNPRSGRWLPDHSHLQHHVGSAVAYNVWQYCLASGDTAFLHTEGAEMLVQVARFWAHSAVWDAGRERYRILGIMGPDEYHDAYPDAAEPGLDDNAYTNVTAAWVLARAVDLCRTMPAPRCEELFERLGLDADEPELWEDVSRRLRVPFHSGVISQFDGYGNLAELDWEGYRARYGDIRRLDRILEAEGDTVNRYQASKQADVLMLGYLFPPAEPAALFERLGYPMDHATWQATVDHYLARTSHGSTLSGLVHGWVLARSRRAGAWDYVREALLGDVADIQGGTTGEGIHLGAMGGTLDLVQRGLTGLQPRADALRLDPVPLPELSRFHLSLRYRTHWGVGLTLQSGRLRIRVPPSDQDPIPVSLDGRTYAIAPGSELTVDLPAA
ncbi:glycoside hydrolase family 65 protein [Actinacidiphila bryophytorum]|uniref:Trehalose and maltose hydrolase (Phosphorylase) n=1 Tax=Actinacidiphila bryophytorum TaxID=1436133 RepID=A0A9W4MID0_9ACTN|nr:glycosyl hydrolase family 65 protein [Actinacidiphila bryophytorum]MBM9437073.1 glycoside hydrolase family 65 protein [Actinacidiphila bryophytorum]MBN6544169.1 glycoside hydrolase family 65 protein [Actinacidiphila bryophytorum]CAG7646506.1 putative Trehalose and maltose hydrolase (phosphorylase) [Actinacidiphila bryophytorum]